LKLVATRFVCCLKELSGVIVELNNYIAFLYKIFKRKKIRNHASFPGLIKEVGMHAKAPLFKLVLQKEKKKFDHERPIIITPCMIIRQLLRLNSRIKFVAIGSVKCGICHLLIGEKYFFSNSSATSVNYKDNASVNLFIIWRKMHDLISIHSFLKRN
jgi:hypothetical protein